MTNRHYPLVRAAGAFYHQLWEAKQVPVMAVSTEVRNEAWQHVRQLPTRQSFWYIVYPIHRVFGTEGRE